MTHPERFGFGHGEGIESMHRDAHAAVQGSMAAAESRDRAVQRSSPVCAAPQRPQTAVGRRRVGSKAKGNTAEGMQETEKKADEENVPENASENGEQEVNDADEVDAEDEAVTTSQQHSDSEYEDAADVVDSELDPNVEFSKLKLSERRRFSDFVKNNVLSDVSGISRIKDADDLRRFLEYVDSFINTCYVWPAVVMRASAMVHDVARVLLGVRFMTRAFAFLREVLGNTTITWDEFAETLKLQYDDPERLQREIADYFTHVRHERQSCGEFLSHIMDLRFKAVGTTEEPSVVELAQVLLRMRNDALMTRVLDHGYKDLSEFREVVTHFEHVLLTEACVPVLPVRTRVPSLMSAVTVQERAGRAAEAEVVPVAPRRGGFAAQRWQRGGRRRIQTGGQRQEKKFVSMEEKRRRLEQNLCFACGGADHYARYCVDDGDNKSDTGNTKDKKSENDKKSSKNDSQHQ